MSALRLINETTATSVSVVEVTDVFTSDFEIYKVEVVADGASTSHWTSMRYLNTSGGAISTTNHLFNMFELQAYQAFSENRSTAGNKFNYLFIDNGSNSGVGFTMYVFNPASASSWTQYIGSSGGFYSTSGNSNTKTIGTLKEAVSLGGFQLTRYTGSWDSITIRTYGIRIDK
jgi:hypothetical protein